MSEQGLVDRSMLPQGLYCPLEVDRVPERNGGDHEIESAGPVPLILIRTVADFTESMKEYGPRQRVARLAFVQSAGDSATQCRIAQPFEREQGALDLELPLSDRTRRGLKTANELMG